MRDSQRFERQIERIHKLIEADDADVVWNDRISDPDNPVQLRQIDVAIRRECGLTLVECRIHQAPQDVKWIEELMGRRESLGAIAVIAVSASGFTEGAIKKAHARGVILRTLDTLTEEEISNWGREVGVTTTSYRFIECSFFFELSEAPEQPFVLSDPIGQNIDGFRLLGAVMDKLEADAAAVGAYNIEVEIEAGVLISGLVPRKCSFVGSVEKIERKLKLASVVGYKSPRDTGLQSHAVVRKYDQETIEVIDSSLELAVIVDLSSANLLPNEFVRSAVFDFGHVMETKWFHIVGVDLSYKGPLRLHVSYPQVSI